MHYLSPNLEQVTLQARRKMTVDGEDAFLAFPVWCSTGPSLLLALWCGMGFCFFSLGLYQKYLWAETLKGCYINLDWLIEFHPKFQASFLPCQFQRVNIHETLRMLCLTFDVIFNAQSLHFLSSIVFARPNDVTFVNTGKEFIKMMHSCKDSLPELIAVIMVRVPEPHFIKD